MKSIKKYLPEIYHSLLPDFFSNELPIEVFSTCKSCPKIKGSLDENGYNKITKCCTFFPEVPNYLVGAVLNDKTILANRVMKDAISIRVGVYPNQLGPGAKYWLLYYKSENTFGKAESMVCPYLEKDSGDCGMWSGFTETIFSINVIENR